MRYFALLFLFSFLTSAAWAQDDSIAAPVPPAVDTVPPPVKDTVKAVRARPTPRAVDSVVVTEPASFPDTLSPMPWQFGLPPLDEELAAYRPILNSHPYFNFLARPVVIHPETRKFQGKETLFYVLIAFLLAYAGLRQAFPKYFNDLFRLLFRTTLKQKQLREQLMQSPIPSFLLNVFFALSGGLYIDLLLQYFQAAPVAEFWLLFLYCSLALGAIYAVKYAGLNITGWLFNIRPATESYSFLVFLINKVIGIFLLPFLILLSFVEGDFYRVAMVISWCGVGLFLVYRYLLTYSSVRNQVKLNPFHFFLYLCAFEIAPLLLIYKGLLFFFRQN